MSIVGQIAELTAAAKFLTKHMPINTQLGWRGIGFAAFANGAQAFLADKAAGRIVGQYDFVDVNTGQVAELDVMRSVRANGNYSRLRLLSYDTGDTIDLPVTAEIVDLVTANQFVPAASASSGPSPLLIIGAAAAILFFLSKKRR